MVLDFTQMVLAVQKHLEMAIIIILNNLCFNNFPEKLIPGDVGAQVLQEPVGASHADQGWKSGVPSIFFGPWGSRGTQRYPTLGPSTIAVKKPGGGGSCSNIYKDKVN